MPIPLSSRVAAYVRVAALTLLSIFLNGCISFTTYDHEQLEDRVVEDTRTLSVELLEVAPPNLRLKLSVAGEKTIERTTVTDRQVTFKVQSGVERGFNEFGLNPILLFFLPFAIAGDAAQLAVSLPTQIPAGLWAGIDPPDRVSTVVERQAVNIPTHLNVVVRYGPRLVETVLCGSNNEITVEARRAAQNLLASGASGTKIRVRIDAWGLEGSVVVDEGILRQLAGGSVAGR